MTQGFYEILGADPTGDLSAIRSAYAAVLSSLERRERAMREQGGDLTSLERSRRQAEEAWSVLSDPARRRRYDAMRALTEEGWTTDPDTLWERASGALIPPAAAEAVELLRATTTLALGPLPPSPGAMLRRQVNRVREEERTVTATTMPRIPMPAPSKPAVPPAVIATPSFGEPEATAPPTFIQAEDTTPLEPPSPEFRVVQGQPGAPDVLLMNPQAASLGEPSPEEIQRMVDAHGFSGALLRAMRERRGMSIQDMADTTRISVRYLEGVEREAMDALPSATFVRGYVREMARTLGLDDHLLVPGYMQRVQ